MVDSPSLQLDLCSVAQMLNHDTQQHPDMTTTTDTPGQRSLLQVTADESGHNGLKFALFFGNSRENQKQPNKDGKKRRKDILTWGKEKKKKQWQ